MQLELPEGSLADEEYGQEDEQGTKLHDNPFLVDCLGLSVGRC
jgi:hypothetical protein